MNAAADTVFLFDVDNTLFDNDRIREDLRERLRATHGDRACARYWEIMDELWAALGYMDYLGALERLRLEDPHYSAIFGTANRLLDYPFADRLYPHALEAVEHVASGDRPPSCRTATPFFSRARSRARAFGRRSTAMW